MHHGQTAAPRLTVPVAASVDLGPSTTTKRGTLPSLARSIRIPTAPLALFVSQNERTSGTSFPQAGPSQRILPQARTSAARFTALAGAYSSITRLRSTATGFKSEANASAPTRSASRGIAPPPANGSKTSGRTPGRLPRSADARVSASMRSRTAWLVPTIW